MSNGNAVEQALPRPMTFDESIALLARTAKEKGSDDWKVKVLRRSSPTAPMESLAVLDGATVDHFANPESWLVPFCGGGPYFVLSAYHNAEPNVLVASVVPPMINLPAKPADPSVVGAEGWVGPARLTFALNTLPKAQQQHPQATPPQRREYTGLGGAGSVNGGEPAPRTLPAPTLPVPALFTASPEAALLQRIADDRAALQQERHRLEVEAARRESAEAIRRLEAKIADAQARPVAPPAPTLMEQIPALLTALAPFLTAMEQRRQEDRRLMQELEAKREERAERQREESAKREALLLERVSSSSGEASKLAAGYTEAISNMSRTMVQTLASTQELMLSAQPPPPDEGFMGIVKAAVTAFAEYTAASKMAQIEAAAARPVGSPPRQPRPQSPPAPSKQPALGSPAAQPAPTQVAPAKVEGQPAAPVESPHAAAVEEAEDATDDSSEEGVEISQADPNDVLHALESNLREHVEPAEVAAFYLDALANPGVQASIKSGGGTIPFFQARLGKAWIDVPENFEYMKAVLLALQAEATSRGVTGQ